MANHKSLQTKAQPTAAGQVRETTLCPGFVAPFPAVKTVSQSRFVRVAESLYTGTAVAPTTPSSRKSDADSTAPWTPMIDMSPSHAWPLSRTTVSSRTGSPTSPRWPRHWLESNRQALSVATTKRKRQYLDALEPFFGTTALRNIQPRHCENMGSETIRLRQWLDFGKSRGRQGTE